MKIIAIDPGTTSLGWAILDGESLIDYGALQFNDREPLLDRLNRIYTHFFKLISDYPSEVLALEKTWKVDRGSVALAVAIKVIKETAELIDGLRVVQERANSVRAKFRVGARDRDTAKERVKTYIIDQFDIEDDMPSDVYDAILIGLWALEYS